MAKLRIYFSLQVLCSLCQSLLSISLSVRDCTDLMFSNKLHSFLPLTRPDTAGTESLSSASSYKFSLTTA